MKFKQQSLFEWAEAYLSLGTRLWKKEPDLSYYDIEHETLAYLVLTAVMQQDMHLARQICSIEAVLNGEGREGSDEWQ